jgi:hypothetical protein
MSRLKEQLEMVKSLSNLIKESAFEHHFDGSTARVLQGVNETMNDIDIVFPFSKLNEVRKLFITRDLSPVKMEAKTGMYHMFYVENDEKVHLLFFHGSEKDFYENHIQVNLDGEDIWVKGLEHFNK